MNSLANLSGRIKILTVACVMIVFTACEKEIKVTLPDYSNKVVIEGSIENGQPAVVMVTRSMPYFSYINIDTLMNKVFINNAIVTVTSSSGESEQLVFTRASDISSFYFAYVSPTLRGEEGKIYTLKVEFDGQEYSAVTSILHPFALDSIGFAPFKGSDSTLSVRALMTDNPATTDYYRFQVKVRGKKLHDRFWASCMPVAFDDLTFSGLTMNVEVLRTFPLRLFLEDMNDEQRKEYNRRTYRKGDTVYVKYSCIDYDSYRYWITAAGELNGGNPFRSPAPIISNIKGNNVLGAWCGYASKIDTLYFR
ncbi:MAG: DUF4249 domain-containing protein [Bacteroidales bacterium]|jgi:hypothetical protein|nr:DUF4249 domain-containing protein [Bacteroidales bacterium]